MKVKIEYETDKQNEEYLILLNFNLGKLGIIIDSTNPPQIIREELMNLWRALLKAQEANADLGEITEIAIKKESILGEYLLTHTDYETIIDKDSFISYEMIINATLIAIYKDDAKLSNKIIPLFQQHVEGSTKELISLYPNIAPLLDYIKQNSDFNAYLTFDESKPQKQGMHLVYNEEEKFVTSSNVLEEDLKRSINREISHKEKIDENNQ